MAVPRLQLVLRSYDLPALNAFLRMLPGQGRRGLVRLPTEKKRFVVNRSPHVNGKSKDVFERRTHKVLVPIEAPNATTLRWIAALRDSGTYANVTMKMTVMTGGGGGSTAAAPAQVEAQEVKQIEE
jgi:ribosomal protein S10